MGGIVASRAAAGQAARDETRRGGYELLRLYDCTPEWEKIPMAHSPFAIREIDHVVLRIRDLERSLRFYCDVLGCTVERRQDAIGLIQLRAGRSLIDLVPLDGKLGRAGGAAPDTEGRNVDHICLRIEPFDGDAIFAHLRSQGVEPGEVESRFGAEGKGPSIYICDPDANVVELKGPPERA
jgi:glyoxylase I family protein